MDVDAVRIELEQTPAPTETTLRIEPELTNHTNATIEADNDTVTLTAHGLSDGDLVVFHTLAGGTGLTVGTTYYVRDAAANTFKVAATRSGAAVDVTVDATDADFISSKSTADSVSRTAANKVTAAGADGGVVVIAST